uniref:Arf-GAP domain-containing protein n=2 Tax=Palpitomonas bilix TaxID=652834 RepID=A0A7S3DBH8_9EUKA
MDISSTIASIAQEKMVPMEKAKEILSKIRLRQENKTCFDCPAKNPSWASATFGVFLCYHCSGFHRNMGTHISFVRSAEMDGWRPDHLVNMLLGGNGRADKYFKQHGVQKDSKATDKYNNRGAQMYKQALHADTKKELAKYANVRPVASSPAPSSASEKSESGLSTSSKDFLADEIAKLSVAQQPQRAGVPPKQAAPHHARSSSASQAAKRTVTVKAAAPAKSGLGAKRISSGSAFDEAMKESASAGGGNSMHRAQSQPAMSGWGDGSFMDDDEDEESVPVKATHVKAPVVAAPKGTSFFDEWDTVENGGSGGDEWGATPAPAKVSALPATQKATRASSSGWDDFDHNEEEEKEGGEEKKDDFGWSEPHEGDDFDSLWQASSKSKPAAAVKVQASPSKQQQKRAGTSDPFSASSKHDDEWDWGQGEEEGTSTSANKFGYDDPSLSGKKKGGAVGGSTAFVSAKPTWSAMERDESNSFEKGSSSSSRFGGSKSISSDAYFGQGEKDEGYHAERMQTLKGANAISSDMYFGRSDSNGSGSGRGGSQSSDTIRAVASTAKKELGQMKKILKDGSSKIGAFASNLFQTLQERYV